jgi:hypothetical protein
MTLKITHLTSRLFKLILKSGELLLWALLLAMNTAGLKRGEKLGEPQLLEAL